MTIYCLLLLPGTTQASVPLIRPNECRMIRLRPGFQSLHSQTHLIYFPLSKCDKMEILAEGDRGISPSNFTLH